MILFCLSVQHKFDFESLTNIDFFFFYSEWSDTGCYLRSANATHTVCSCDHLTNFAVLMDVHASKFDTVRISLILIGLYVKLQTLFLFQKIAIAVQGVATP